MLASVFAVTLRRGETPLIVRIAELDSATLTPQFRRYLQGLTQGWAIFFFAMADLSLLLMLYAPFEWWSLFINVLSWPLIGVMFIAEWLVRVVCFRKLPRHTPLYIAAKILAYQRQVTQMRARVARRMTSEPLIAHRAANARIAVRGGESISAGRFVAARTSARATVAARTVRAEQLSRSLPIRGRLFAQR